MAKEITLSPSYLFLGQEENVQDIVKKFVKKSLCPSDGCNLCIDCKKIDKKVHHLAIWLEPESQYNLEDLESIFKTVVFALDVNQHFFFVINKAQYLNQFCANSLLKLMEEPPKGYHFILTAQMQDRILPTILSRCIVYNYNSTSSQNSVLLKHFTDLKNPNFAEFLKILQASKIPEQEIINLIDQIYFFWSDKLRDCVVNGHSENINFAEKALNILDDSRSENIMPGSGKIFLRNLYIKFLLLKNGQN